MAFNSFNYIQVKNKWYSENAKDIHFLINLTPFTIFTKTTYFFTSMFNSKIAGVGHFLPENVVTNKSLESVMETTDEWIQERTGIKERRWVVSGDGNTTSSMGTKAARKAIKNANLIPDDIDFIVFATLSPDYYFPGPGVMVQKNLGIKEIGALDIRNQCSGFIYRIG